MTEERLEKIKQDIEVMDTYGGYKDRYLELYNEVVRLRKILNCKEELCKYLPKDTELVILAKKDYERLTLEQLTGVDNA